MMCLGCPEVLACKIKIRAIDVIDFVGLKKHLKNDFACSRYEIRFYRKLFDLRPISTGFKTQVVKGYIYKLNSSLP